MAADPDALGARYEASLPAGRRRRLGAHYTPPALADELVGLALGHLRHDGVRRPLPLVCDPSCGGGAFLLAAARALAAAGLDRRLIATELVWGCDLDPAAVAVAADAIEAWAGVAPPDDHLVVGDGLTVGTERGWAGRFDIVVGNPPFLNQLESATVRRRPLPPALANIAGPYSDTAWLFLVAGVDLATAGGTVVLLQPQSIAAARDAAPIRAAVEARASLEALWSTVEQPFAASVQVCAPVLHVGATGQTPSPWASLLRRPHPAPAVELPTGTGTLVDVATATAGFREQFYGLAPFVVDDPAAADDDMPRLVTSGLIDVGGCSWGIRRARFAKQRFMAPRVDMRKLEHDRPKLGRWVRDRLRPKVVVATQTKVIEAAVDEAGTWVPSTPVISVEPFAAADVWCVAAVLLAPPISAWAMHTYAGTALSPDAIKLSARQVVQFPLPGDAAAWASGAAALRRGDIGSAAGAMNHAYGASSDVLAWWTRRVPSCLDGR